MEVTLQKSNAFTCANINLMEMSKKEKGLYAHPRSGNYTFATKNIELPRNTRNIDFLQRRRRRICFPKLKYINWQTTQLCHACEEYST